MQRKCGRSRTGLARQNDVVLIIPMCNVFDSIALVDPGRGKAISSLTQLAAWKASNNNNNDNNSNNNNNAY